MSFVGGVVPRTARRVRLAPKQALIDERAAIANLTSGPTASETVTMRKMPAALVHMASLDENAALSYALGVA